MVNIGIRLYDNTIHHIGDIASTSGAETTITTIVDYQSKAEVEILVGESAYSDRYCSIGTLLIRNLPPAKAGEPRINLKFRLDAGSALTIHVFSKDVLKKQVKIPKKAWEPSSDEYEKGRKDSSPGIKNLFAIDFSFTDSGIYTGRETGTKQERLPSKEKEEDEEEIPGTKGRDILVPLLIIISLVIVVFFAIYFFFVLQPWDTGESDLAGLTRPASTQKISPTEVATPVSTVQEMTPALTQEPEEEVPTPEIIRVTASDLAKINNELKEIGPVYFTPNSAELVGPGEMKKIDQIASVIREHSPDILLLIKGHTAKAGSMEERQELSLERAEMIRDALINRGAITEENCRIEGFGSRNPAATTPGKGNLNRRVEFQASLPD